MGHVVLLGDSIFDNNAYVRPGEPAVIEQVRAALPDGWDATLLAVDGSVTGDVPGQLAGVPSDTTHLVVSAGGNDALEHLSMLTEDAASVAEVFGRIAAISEQFERSYLHALEAVLRRNLPTALCTIYYPSFPDEMTQRLACTGLTVFNDAILRAAASAGVPVLDLRLICTEPSDYANPIEPSARGGEKIARVIAQVVASHNFAGRRAVMYS